MSLTLRLLTGVEAADRPVTTRELTARFAYHIRTGRQTVRTIMVRLSRSGLVRGEKRKGITYWGRTM